MLTFGEIGLTNLKPALSSRVFLNFALASRLLPFPYRG
jgi:hypothetical protein